MKKISLFCALALIGSTAFALDRAGCESLKDVKILNNEMIDAAWHEKGESPKSMLAKSKTYASKEFLVCAYPKVATYVGGDTSKASSFVCK
ncbi:tannase/feruloyl esterase family alpha/beta hydrolase [Campylobacter concisus]|uniref:Uncharacterized protein n=1 Tax=Campylobacter concisus TaxID=199 RepID=A0A1Y5NAG1_9BACT|nr:tannase/feruloyl esterase family alpha/beta hydrolase [Campylobacter concisus]OUT17499.1 hypothetical protein B9N61_07240 [Campylobacter concisus]